MVIVFLFFINKKGGAFMQHVSILNSVKSSLLRTLSMLFSKSGLSFVSPMLLLNLVLVKIKVERGEPMDVGVNPLLDFFYIIVWFGVIFSAIYMFYKWIEAYFDGDLQVSLRGGVRDFSSFKIFSLLLIFVAVFLSVVYLIVGAVIPIWMDDVNVFFYTFVQVLLILPLYLIMVVKIFLMLPNFVVHKEMPDLKYPILLRFALVQVFCIFLLSLIYVILFNVFLTVGNGGFSLALEHTVGLLFAMFSAFWLLSASCEFSIHYSTMAVAKSEEGE